MSVIIDSYENIDITSYEEIIHNVVNISLEYEKCPYETEISITFVDNNEIREINKLHRNHNKITDVLSFPMLEFAKHSDFSSIDESKIEYFNLDNKKLLLGDIVISMEKAKEQASIYGHTLKREIGFLIVHSMLHLMGYDHMNEEEEVIMRYRQEEILKKVGLLR